MLDDILCRVKNPFSERLQDGCLLLNGEKKHTQCSSQNKCVAFRINLAAETLRVEETCYQGHFGTPKTKASRRELPLPPVVVKALLAHRSRCSDKTDEALVFCTSNGTPVASNNVRKRQLHPACLRAGLAPINWHTLRHTHGTLLHEQGTPLRVAQAQLGHSHMTITLEVYTHASAGAQRRAVEQLENPFGPKVLPM